MSRPNPTTSTFPTDAEREAIWRYVSAVCCDVTQAVKAAERIQDALAPLVADRERAAAARALKEAYDPVWDSSVPPGGFVCNICRFPVESEPCADHGPDEDDALEAGEDRG